MSNFFGTFLISKGVLTQTQLDEALNIQKDMNKRIGELAIAEGLLSEEDVERLLSEQRNVDKKLGALIKDHGYANGDIIQKLLTTQMDNHIYLGTVLVNNGFIDKITLKSLVQEFNNHSEDLFVNEITFPTDAPQNRYLKLFFEHVPRLLFRIADINSKIGPLRDSRRFARKEYIPLGLDIEGDISLKLLIGFDRATATHLTRRYLLESYVRPRMVEEGSKEFLNNVASQLKLSFHELKSEIRCGYAYIVEKDINAGKDNHMLTCPLFTTYGYSEISAIFPAE